MALMQRFLPGWRGLPTGDKLNEIVDRVNGVVAGTFKGTIQALTSMGFVTGAGGAVTQLTSKSTGVTLNKPVGAITMNNAGLATNTSVMFTLTNSQIGANDLVAVCIKSGATTLGYHSFVEAVAAGSANIVLRNVSAGTLSEAVVITFAVIKGVIA